MILSLGISYGPKLLVCTFSSKYDKYNMREKLTWYKYLTYVIGLNAKHISVLSCTTSVFTLLLSPFSIIALHF